MQQQRRMELTGSHALRRGVLSVLLLALLAVGSPQAVQAAQPSGATGYIEICKDRVPGITGVYTFTIEGQSGRHSVAPGTCTPPIQVPAGRVTIRETNIPGDVFLLDARAQAPGSLIAIDRVNGTIEVNVPAGGTAREVVVSVTDVPAGWIEFCKVGPGLSGTFPVTYQPRDYPFLVTTVTVPVGACTAPIKVPAGWVDIAETQRADTRLTDVRVRRPGDRFERISPQDGLFSVNVPRGDASQEIVVTLINEPTVPPFKICKVAGHRVPQGTEFDFTVTDGSNRWTLSIPAGPIDSGGFCKFVPLPPGYLAGTVITITEHLPRPPAETTWLPPQITIDPGPPASAVGTSVTFALAPGLNVVTFTNNLEVEPIRIKVCKVAGSGVAEGTDFRFTLTSNGRPTSTVVVPAGPAPGGFCNFAPENTYGEGDVVTITEEARDGVQTTAISVLPPDRQSGAPNLGGRSVTIVAGDGVSTVTFTNATGGR